MSLALKQIKDENDKKDENNNLKEKKLERELTEEEIKELPIGPDPAVLEQ